MTSATAQSFSPIELAWVRAQTPENLSVTTVALVSEGPLDPGCIKSRIEDRLLSEERFRQRMGHSHLPLARPRWQEHERFQLSDHFSYSAGAMRSSTDLADVLSRLSSQPLDEELPLWQIHLVDHEKGGSVLILRLHAAVADSKAAAALALRLVDAEGPIARTELGLEHRVPLRSLGAEVGKPAAATRLLCRLITSRADRRNPFRGRPTGSKTLEWSEPIDLGPVQSTETCLAAVVDALRKAAHRQDVPAEDVELRAVISLDLRRPGDPLTGTRAALGLLRLPLQAPAPVDRLAAIEREVERFSLAPERLTLLGSDGDPSLTMSEIEERSLRLLSQKATVALAILDGPARPQHLCKRPITQFLWWPALTGDTALGITLVTYGGQVQFGVSCDEAIDTDAAALVADMASAATEP